MDNRVWRIVLAIIFPPLAVLDKGCGTTLIVTLLTVPLWFPGMIVAIMIILADKSGEQMPLATSTSDDVYEKEKRKGAYIRLADGEVAEVIEDDHAPLKDYQHKK